MQPEKIELVGDFLAIRWPNGEETVLSLEDLRRACPCARCSGESDLTGQVHRVAEPLPLDERSFRVLRWEQVGNYALQPFWADGHETGIYTWSYLRELGAALAED